MTVTVGGSRSPASASSLASAAMPFFSELTSRSKTTVRTPVIVAQFPFGYILNNVSSRLKLVVAFLVCHPLLLGCLPNLGCFLDFGLPHSQRPLTIPQHGVTGPRCVDSHMFVRRSMGVMV